MKAFGNRFIRVTRRVSALLLALIVVLFISSCSDEGMKLCRVNLDTGSISRNLDAIVNTSEIDQDFLIYYRAIYKGKGTAYGDMSQESKYKLFGTEGILLAQGLWRIDVLLTNKTANTTPASEIEKGDITNPLEGTTGDVFVNLNTNTFRVTIGQGSGTGSISFTYSLIYVSNHEVNVAFYNLNGDEVTVDGFTLTHPVSDTAEPNKYISGANNKPLNYQLATGIYYAVVTVKQNNATLFTDSIGFVIKKDVLTKLEGFYHKDKTTGTIIEVSTPGSSGSTTDSSNHEDIKEWGGNEFNDGSTYRIAEESYTFVFSEASNRNKVLENKEIVIDLNGNRLINVIAGTTGIGNSRGTKTYFTVSSGSYLSVLNSGGTTNAPSIYGFDMSIFNKNNNQFLSAINKPSFIVDSGKLRIGGNSELITSRGHIIVTGCPARVPADSNNYRYPAIGVTDNGGSIILDGNTNTGVTINDAVSGISTMNGNSASLALNFDLDISLKNASIITNGSYRDNKNNIITENYGIYLDASSRNGSITIELDGKDNVNSDTNLRQKYTIYTSGSTTNETNAYGIYVANFKGPIDIILKNVASINSSDGYGIYIDKTCTGEVNISIDSTSSISGAKGALYLKGETITQATPNKNYNKPSSTT